MKEKELYTSPEVDVFVIQTEGVICVSGAGSTEPGTFDDSIPWGF